MYENDYMYAIERSDEYLAHYGIRGMKWGVRKAIASGNGRRLGRQYAKAQKKLAKLEKRAASGKKYAKRAAMLGAGAAAAGGLAVAGTSGIANAIGKGGFAAGKAMRGFGDSVMRPVGNSMARLGGRIKNKKLAEAGIAVSKAGRGMRDVSNNFIRGAGRAGVAVNKWGNSASLSKSAAGAMGNATKRLAGMTGGNQTAMRAVGKLDTARRKVANSGVTNNTIARIGAGAVGAGLAGAAGYNAYRAATTKRAAKKAAQFRSEMNKAFKGTQYDTSRNRQGKKRRRG